MYIRGKYPRQKTKPYRREIMKKKITKTPKKTAVCACKVGVSKSTPKSVSCAAKSTPIKASLESVIASPTILKKPNTPRLPAIGTTFIKKFKGKGPADRSKIRRFVLGREVL